MEIPRAFRIKVLCCTLLVMASSVAQEHQSAHAWDYGDALGPSHWGDLSPEFVLCKNGHQQSPIDIKSAKEGDLPPLQFDYKASPLRIIDNGHTVMVNYEPGSSLSFGGRKYELKQFHFHRPSEERINGEHYDMSVHLVHMDDAGDLAVVAVLLQKGEENALVRKLWTNLPKDKEKEKSRDDVQINVSGLLPPERGYYAFAGSLTTPPCSENVAWFVLKQPATISNAQIEQFSNLYRNNARPIQPLYERVVLKNK